MRRVREAVGRQRPLRIDVGPDGRGVMKKVDPHKTLDSISLPSTRATDQHRIKILLDLLRGFRGSVALQHCPIRPHEELRKFHLIASEPNTPFF